MKKTFVALLVSAVAVWGYVVVQIIVAVVGRSESTSREQDAGSLPAIALLSRPRSPLDTAFRDPFQSYLYAQKPAPVVAAPRPAHAVLKVIEPPRVVVGGILWGEQPVAILKQDGRTELVRKGGEVWGLKVVRIDRNLVVVLKEGRQFTLEY